MNHSKKMEYVKLLRAQLSSHELLLLFYNCLSEKGMRKTKALVERYALLEHVPQDKLVPKQLNMDHNHVGLYERGAFEET